MARMNKSVEKKGRRLMRRSMQEQRKKKSNAENCVESFDHDAELFFQ